MDQKLVVANYPFSGGLHPAAVLYEDGKPVYIELPEAHSDICVGSVYVGIIEKIQKNLDAAFVRFTDQETGYLPLRGQTYKCGDRLIIQVEKEALKSKLPRLTEHICITGRYFVMDCNGGNIRYSKKLSETERSKLQELLAGDIFALDHQPADNNSGNDSRPDTTHYAPVSSGQKSIQISKKMPGVTVRTNAREASEEDLKEEFLKLRKTVWEILQYGNSRSLYSCLFRPQNSLSDILNQLHFAEVTRIVTDHEGIYQELQQYCTQVSPVLYRDPMVELFQLYNFTTIFSEVSAKQVWLKSGGFLTIEQTEAFVCIDVNSGRNIRKEEKDQNIIRTNREALTEIARQVKLRRLSGTILVDLINRSLSKEEEFKYTEELCKNMQDEFYRASVQARVIDVTKLGIMEIACRKVYKSLKEQLNQLA